MEFTFRCKVPACGVSQGWDSDEAAQAAAGWHVYEVHPEIWLEIVGDYPPADRRPEDLGRRFEDWERQS